MRVAALFVEENGVYSNIPEVDVWALKQDARLYAGPWPVVCHPPCERWGRYWSGGPNVKTKRVLGDDNGCFISALASVRKWGGVLEHPEASQAWRVFGLKRPTRTSGWVRCDAFGWSCCVEQGWYGHLARKRTWLYYAGAANPPNLQWGPCQPKQRIEESFKSSLERRVARQLGIPPIPRLTRQQRIDTPLQFRDLLLQISRGSRL